MTNNNQLAILMGLTICIIIIIFIITNPGSKNKMTEEQKKKRAAFVGGITGGITGGIVFIAWIIYLYKKRNWFLFIILWIKIT